MAFFVSALREEKPRSGFDKIVRNDFGQRLRWGQSPEAQGWAEHSRRLHQSNDWLFLHRLDDDVQNIERLYEGKWLDAI